MLSAYSSRIWVGVNANTGPDLRQGMVNVLDEDNVTATKSIPMIIRPASAVRTGLSFFHYRNVIAQLNKMGINPMTIEIYGENSRFVYDGKKYELIMREDKVKELPKDPGLGQNAVMPV